METNTLVAVHRAMDELRALEQTLILSMRNAQTSHSIPTNEVLMKHHPDNKSWKVTRQKPTVTASYAFNDSPDARAYPNIQTLDQGDQPLVEFFENLTNLFREKAEAGEELTYLDIRYSNQSLTLDIVDREEPKSDEPTDTE